VNTISPLLTTSDKLLRQTTFYPFVLFSNHAAGQSLQPLTTAPQSDTKLFGPMPLLDVSASYDQANDRGAVFIVNRSQHEAVTTELGWQGTAPAQISEAYQISGSDPKAANTFEQPNAIVPKTLDSIPIHAGCLTLRLPPLSFTVLATAGYGKAS
jgi:alpha-L-arabinofuranosidase